MTYQRLKENLGKLKKADDKGPQGGGRLPQVLFGTAEPDFVENPPLWKPFNSSLDKSQIKAVDKALAAKDIALIHGPPGTGKSTAVVELVLQECARGNKASLFMHIHRTSPTPSILVLALASSSLQSSCCCQVLSLQKAACQRDPLLKNMLAMLSSLLAC